MAIMNIPKYITVKSKRNDFDFYHYLHIRGGAGDSGRGEHRYGGEYDYIVFYASPEEMEGCAICERLWCIQNNIVFGEGASIEEAYKNYQKKVK